MKLKLQLVVENVFELLSDEKPWIEKKAAENRDQHVLVVCRETEIENALGSPREESQEVILGLTPVMNAAVTLMNESTCVWPARGPLWIWRRPVFVYFN